jgi:hypothetical protein
MDRRAAKSTAGVRPDRAPLLRQAMRSRGHLVLGNQTKLMLLVHGPAELFMRRSATVQPSIVVQGTGGFARDG